MSLPYEGSNWSESNTSTPSQVSNCNGISAWDLMDSKFQWAKKSLNFEPCTYNVFT